MNPQTPPGPSYGNRSREKDRSSGWARDSPTPRATDPASALSVVIWSIRGRLT